MTRFLNMPFLKLTFMKLTFPEMTLSLGVIDGR